MLDLVPDSVFICSKSKGDEKAPQGLFANFRMNQFFGCDVLQSSIATKKPKKSFLRRKKPNTMNINGRQVDIES